MKKAGASEWLEELNRAIKRREDWRARFRVSTAYEYFEGAQRPQWAKEDEWITINLIYSTLLSELPSLYMNNPWFFVKLSRCYKPDPNLIAMYEASASTRESMLNYLKGELDLRGNARLSVQDAMFQYGVFKVCYYSEMVKNEAAGEPMYGESGSQLIDEYGTPMVQPEELSANEAYKLIRIDPDDYVVDADAGPLDSDITWEAQRIVMSLEDAKANKAFNTSARNKLEPTVGRYDSDKDREERKSGSIGETDGKKPEMVETWEIYDRKNGKTLTISQGCDDFLVDPEDLPMGIDKTPFATLRFTLRKDSWYPIPPVSQWIDSQREYCETRSKIMTHRKRFSRIYELDQSSFDNAEIAAAQLQNAEDGTVLMRTNNNGLPAVYPVKDAPLDMQVHTELSYLKGDFSELSVGMNQRGSGSGIDSATEARIIEFRSQAREGDWKQQVGEFITIIGRKLDQQVQANITEDQAVKVSGPGGESWKFIRAADYEDIDGEYEYSIDVGTMAPQLPEVERAQWLQLISILSQDPTFATSEIIMQETARMHSINNDPLVKEIVRVAKMKMGMMAQQAQQKQGSMPNVSQQNPLSAVGGMAFGSNNVMGR